MPRGKKFHSKKDAKQKPKKKEKFNYRTASYIKEREARIEEIENRRKRIEEIESRRRIEEYKIKLYGRKDESSSEEDEEHAVKVLLKTFAGQSKKITVVSDSESDDVEDEENEEVDEDGQDVEMNEDNIDLPNEENSDSELTNEDDNDAESTNEEDSDSESTNEEDSDAESTNEELIDEEVESDSKQNSKSEKDSDKNKDKVTENITYKEENEGIVLDLKENDEEDEETAKEDAGHVKDPFTVHLRNDLDDELYKALTTYPKCLETDDLFYEKLGRMICQIPQVGMDEEYEPPAKKKPKISVLEKKCFAETGTIPGLLSKVDWNELYVKSLIQPNISKANYENIKNNLDSKLPLSPLQMELFAIINNYQDLLYPERTFENESEIRFVYCLHVINHVLKTRTKVLHHNAKIKKQKLKDMSEIPDEYRDQGLVRPKVLILVPFRHSCLKIVELFISIFIGEDRGGSVINKNRFMNDFGGSEIIMPKRNPKPEDYEQTFKGNTDDTFKIGISITKKAIKLYSDFYSSDIIIASPLGLRMTIGAEGEEERDYDFLASIELLILDQTEIFFMQNWDHLLHIFDHMHLQPKNSHGTDFARVRSWCVNGWSKYYRQTLIFSSIQLPEIHGIFNKRCVNYAGKLKTINPTITGTVSQVVVQVPQVFERFNVNDHAKAIDARFEFFTTVILPQFKDSIMNNTLIFIPSYFDYVKLRNYFRKEELSFVQICEYTEDGKVAKARDMFFHSDAHMMLYTERFHFYRRIRLKGIRHIIFYAPPIFPHFYSEMCNLMQEAYQNPKSGSLSNMTVTTLYCKYDNLPLSAILSTRRANKMINSEKTTYLVMTDN